MHAAIMLAYFFGVSWIVYSTLRHDHTTDKNKHTHTHTYTCTSHQTSKQINTQHRKHTPSAKEGEVFWRMLSPLKFPLRNRGGLGPIQASFSLQVWRCKRVFCTEALCFVENNGFQRQASQFVVVS